MPPATDQKTADCVAKEEAKATDSCNKACTPPKGDAPECYQSSACAAFVDAVELAVDGGQAGTYCASPNGAFLN